MFEKKPSLLKRFLMSASVGALTAYIGAEMNKALKRYDIRESELSGETLTLHKEEQNPKALDDPKQRFYEFRIRDQKTGQELGTCRLLMGQEADSYYGGHIRIRADHLSQSQRREVDTLLIRTAKSHLMSHLYFVCGPKDAAQAEYFRSLGAAFRKEVKIPADSPYYQKKTREKIEQYSLNLLDEQTEKKIASFGKRR